MVEQIPIHPSIQNIKDEQNTSFPFHIHKKLGISFLVGLFFFAFGVGAYYIGRQSVQTPIIPLVTPTSSTISLTPTNNQFPNTSPTTMVTDFVVPPQIDYSCLSDTDCVIKDAHNCCGYYPKCMNVKSIPNPDYVKKQCERMKVDSVCGYPTIDGCKCINNYCVASKPLPTEKITIKTESSCTVDSDCLIKQASYCCGEKKEYYNWCFNKNENPLEVSCANNGSCPNTVGSATSCKCERGKCTAVF
ncbi:hypothetical protein A2690_00135 [Candidatus Roizmanbacteria bacterium RIFCSPHIGHO2_01_FULL_39_12b]|uniref:Uncharacterized protein n=1 Tax=Candidatus Roizmanbacteria bacterium RIFCSPHIGHO2_01_FULL_39_12b TaxID=1802030 RepID=A0A1F7GEQ0_9BACT|nr:MAG: hypothetical protein A2690_00135 [Candidatus Roizmanbacteria bacterium RIFCSPHIGHO2_01_FULL_39_12b]